MTTADGDNDDHDGRMAAEMGPFSAQMLRFPAKWANLETLRGGGGIMGKR